MDVCGDVVRGLDAQEGEELAHGGWEGCQGRGMGWCGLLGGWAGGKAWLGDAPGDGGVGFGRCAWRLGGVLRGEEGGLRWVGFDEAGGCGDASSQREEECGWEREGWPLGVGGGAAEGAAYHVGELEIWRW